MASAVLQHFYLCNTLVFKSLSLLPQHHAMVCRQLQQCQASKLELLGSQFGHGMILDIFEYIIKALHISYNELENGAVIYSIATMIASYCAAKYHANCEGLPLLWLQLEMSK